MTLREARAVAADLLRQAGDETGARVLEQADVLVECAHAVRVHLPWVSAAPSLCAYLDPAWAAAEVERAHGEALEMHRQRSDGPRGAYMVDAMRYVRMREYHGEWVAEEPDPRGEWDPDGLQD